MAKKKPAPPVTVINMIPKALSAETGQDSEPMLTVNPDNPKHMVGSAFTNDPMGGTLAPIYVSKDGGKSWNLNSIVPADGPMTSDMSVSFSGSGSKLYASILVRGTLTTSNLRTDDFAAHDEMTNLSTNQQSDQPFVQTATVSSGADDGQERVYVGNNDLGVAPQTATLDVFLNAGSGQPPVGKRIRLETRTADPVDGPQVRPTIHADGTVYAVYYGWRSGSGDLQANTYRVTAADVVVVRDDNWGKGNTPFQDLTDPGDNKAGIRVVSGISYAFNKSGKDVNGQQRLGGNLSIAVDPRPQMSSTVYIAWNDEPTEGEFTIHVRRSTDRGVSWSSDLLTVTKGTNPALAINKDGEVGLLYQQLSGDGTARRWSTHFRRSADGTNWSEVVLADTPANTPKKTFEPYIGDYTYLIGVGAEFCGVFSANNTPNEANFPSGVTYQRNHDFTTKTLFDLDGSTEVQPSIDPFFFRIG